ncbi:hypothetical protein GCM10010425_34500 [Streptomyces spororaveus]|uniref:Uncharacterized protein n=1 Tax=Streptomyces spororaveus TaxID=284039 RepID=A0ABQ3TC28_9ACTN|nr:hypothetical protein Sspor_34670 [Streptomyces spororaveus]
MVGVRVLPGELGEERCGEGEEDEQGQYRAGREGRGAGAPGAGTGCCGAGRCAGPFRATLT